MKFYLYHRNERKCDALTNEEARKYLTESQIREAIDAKREDPFEEVAFMVSNGIIVYE